MSVKERCEALQSKIIEACVECGLNLTVIDGNIGFVDQEQKKIVAIWRAEHKASEIMGGN